MRLGNQRASGNVEDRRGMGMVGGGLGVGGIVIAVIAYFLGFDPSTVLNVAEQVRNVGRTTIVQDAWRRGHAVQLHGWIYGLKDGIISDLRINANR